eukprot:537709_1
MGNLNTLNSTVTSIFTEMTPIRSYRTIYSFSWLKSAELMNTCKLMTQYPRKMTQNIILWMHQHHLKMEKAISFICKSKIHQKYRNDECITNFTFSAYGALIPLYTLVNATNKKTNTKYCCFYYVDILFIVISSIIFGQKVCHCTIYH